MQMRAKLLTGGGLLLGVVLLLAVNVFSDATFTSSRLDLTQNHLYTLTEGTRNVLAKLDEPITLRFFLSAKEATRLPGISSYTQRVRELLEEYEREAQGRLRLVTIDPEPFSEQEDRAVGYGLRGVPLDDGDSVFYFGLVGTNSTDDQEVIPFFSPSRERFLEYDLTKLIYQLANPKQKVVGLLSSLPLDGGMPLPGQGLPRPWVVMEQIRQLFEVTAIDADATAIPSNVDVLMLVHPKNLSDATLYAVDQFVLGGGRLLVFVDPYAESDRGPGRLGGGAPTASDLDPLFAQWGIGLLKGKVAGDLPVAERVRVNQQSRSAVVDYPVWMNTQPDQYNTEDVVTAQLSNLLFASAGVLDIKGADGITVTPLIETTPSAMLIDSAQLQFIDDPNLLLRQYRPGGKRLVLAARISGDAHSAFPDGRPTAPADAAETKQDPAAAAKESADGDVNAQTAEPAAPHLRKSVNGINVVVVADADMLNDEFWVQVQNFLGTRIVVPTAANGTFVVNALEGLVGSNDLISVRSRGQYSRPFVEVAQIQQAAELRFREKEQELLNRLRATEDKLVELEQGKQGDEALILNEAQQRELAKFRDEKVRIRKELRDVRHQLRQDIDRLESWTKFVNIGLLPLIIGVGGVFAGVRRMNRRGRRPAASGGDRHAD